MRVCVLFKCRTKRKQASLHQCSGILTQNVKPKVVGQLLEILYQLETTTVPYLLGDYMCRPSSDIADPVSFYVSPRTPSNLSTLTSS